MRARLSAAVQALLPQKLIGRFIYRLARSEIDWLKRLLITGFCRLYPVDLSEAETDELSAYPSFNSFFVRGLRTGARPLDADEAMIVSPVDGRLTEFGYLDGDRLVQAKGKLYTLEALLAEQPESLQAFRGGSFLTVYLAPHNYHRVHAPVAGRLDRGRYVPGRRFSVNAGTAATIDGLFCRNERVALWMSTAIGYAVVVMIGAFNVASLTTVLSGEIASGHERVLGVQAPPRLARGAEIGRFNLGSTIVMIFPEGTVRWLDTLVPGQDVRLGMALGRIVGAGTDPA